MARIGSSGPARPAWLKAAAARFRCHIVAAARLQLVFTLQRNTLKETTEILTVLFEISF